MRKRRALDCTVTATSGPESGASVMTFPWIALMAPIRRATAGWPTSCAGASTAPTAEAKDGRLAGPDTPMREKIKIVFAAWLAFIRPLSNLHGSMQRKGMIYKVLPRNISNYKRENARSGGEGESHRESSAALS